MRLFFVIAFGQLVASVPLQEQSKSIEENVQIKCSPGKLDYYGKKIESVERSLSRFQVYVRMQLDRVLEGVGQHNFKGDHIQEHVVRKVDSIQEAIKRKLEHLEQRIDLNIIKSQNAIDMVIRKLEKMEDSLTVRDSDLEAEMADAVAAIDDMKAACSSVEENVTKVIAKVEKTNKRQQSQTTSLLENINRDLSKNISSIRRLSDIAIGINVNNTRELKVVKNQILDAYDRYATKVFNMYEDIMEKTKAVGIAGLHELGTFASEVRHKSRKAVIQYDDAEDTKTLEEISKKMDSNFQTVLQTQALFLESCHKVQIDESQLEEKISTVLDKLLAVFEEKTTVGPGDLQHLEQRLKAHDSNFRKNFNYVASNLLTLTHKTMNSNNRIEEKLDGISKEMNSMQVLVNNFTLGLQDVQNVLNAQNSFFEDIQDDISIKYITPRNNSVLDLNSKQLLVEHVLDTLSNLVKLLNKEKIEKMYSYYKYELDTSSDVAPVIETTADSPVKTNDSLDQSESTTTEREEGSTTELFAVFVDEEENS